ncbi:hypothetical protein B0H17DRAFT_1274842 [Mycena rosella]|uniref:Uncharacterized protein n=1 Tax=Mycena rosella TaxID=1033263 RepID=A0AAD7GH16_MYCRO|nr:hypothetical protein B0H17DRAFT_1274842 [Mycena rosella]
MDPSSSKPYSSSSNFSKFAGSGRLYPHVFDPSPKLPPQHLLAPRAGSGAAALPRNHPRPTRARPPNTSRNHRDVPAKGSQRHMGDLSRAGRGQRDCAAGRMGADYRAMASLSSGNPQNASFDLRAHNALMALDSDQFIEDKRLVSLVPLSGPIASVTSERIAFFLKFISKLVIMGKLYLADAVCVASQSSDLCMETVSTGIYSQPLENRVLLGIGSHRAVSRSLGKNFKTT